MNKPIISHATNKGLAAFVANPSTPLLILGHSKNGKRLAAYEAAGRLISIEAANVPNYPYLYEIDPETEAAGGIEEVRQAKNKIILKSTSFKQPKLLIINSVDKMSLEAQNALLKTLEEPPASTYIILTADSRDRVLPTIVSRTQAVKLLPVSLELALAHYQSRFDEPAIKKAWAVSAGETGLLHELLFSEGSHQVTDGVAMAKEFLRLDSYGRLNFVESQAGTNDALGSLLDGLGRVLASLHRSSITSDRPSKKLLKSRQLVSNTASQLELNGNARLLGLKLALNLKV